MKRLIYILPILIMTILITSCSCSDNTDNNVVSEKRIKLVEATGIKGKSFYIIEVDGNEYLTQYSGGIIKLDDE